MGARESWNVVASMGDTHPEVVRRLKLASRQASVACSAVGLVVLLGWALDLPSLERRHAALASMKPNAALAFVLTGSSLWLRHRAGAGAKRWSRGLGAAVLAIGAVTLAEYAFGWEAGVDEALFRDAHVHLGPPGRMSPASATNFGLLGGALLFFDAKLPRWRVRPAEWLALLAGLSALLSLLGVLFDARNLYAIGPYAAVALHTALAFLVSSLAVLFARPEEGLMRIAASDSPAGVVARRLLPAALLVPGVVGWLALQGERAGFYDERFGLALFTSSTIVTFAVVVLWNASALLRSDDARRRAEQGVRDSEEALKTTLDSIGDAVIAADRAGRVVRMNPVAEHLTGWTLSEARGRQLPEVFHILDETTRIIAQSPVERVLREGGIVGLANHTLLVSRDGTERAIADSGAPIRDAAGHTHGVVVVFRDQTSERKASEAIRRGEARFRRLIEAGAIGMVLSDTEGNISEANDAFLSIVGYSREDLVAGRLHGRSLNTPDRDRTDAVATMQLRTLRGWRARGKRSWCTRTGRACRS